MSDRAAEIIEAVLLLHSLGKSSELICSQLDLTAAEVQAVIKTKRLPATQKELFDAEPCVKKNRPETSWERVVQVCKIHPASKPTNRKT